MTLNSALYQQLLTETIGPVIYAFVVHDFRGVTKMAAVASFIDPAHAAKAVELYNGKVIDGSKCNSAFVFSALVLNVYKEEPIRVEQIGMNPKSRTSPSRPGAQRTNSGQGPSHPSAPSKSLLDRVSQVPT